MSQAQDLIEELKNRMVGLDSYLNSKELNHIQHFIGDIECGISAIEDAEKFLEAVPVGKYDSDRNKYRNL